MRRSLARLTLLVFLGASCLANPVFAKTPFPTRPIRVVVPVAAGGPVDVVARTVAKWMAEDLGQPVVVENKPGVSSLIGTREVAHSPPDGYTLLATSTTFISAPFFVSDAGYDPFKDFTPITQTVQIPMVLVTYPGMAEHSITELIASARARPGVISYASSGIGSTGYIAAELFSRQAKIQMLGVQYKGNSQSLLDVVSGQVNLMFDQVSNSRAFLASQKIRALGVTTTTRSALLPDVPTIAESGLPGYEDVTFNAFFAPAGTPEEIVTVLFEAVGKALARPEVRDQLLAQGIEVKVSQSPAAFVTYLKQSAERYRGLGAGNTR